MVPIINGTSTETIKAWVAIVKRHVQDVQKKSISEHRDEEIGKDYEESCRFSFLIKLRMLNYTLPATILLGKDCLDDINSICNYGISILKEEEKKDQLILIGRYINCLENILDIDQ